jgi:hypothetical protein
MDTDACILLTQLSTYPCHRELAGLLVFGAHSPSITSPSKIFASSAVNGFYLNSPHILVETGYPKVEWKRLEIWYSIYLGDFNYRSRPR